MRNITQKLKFGLKLLVLVITIVTLSPFISSDTDIQIGGWVPTPIMFVSGGSGISCTQAVHEGGAFGAPLPSLKFYGQNGCVNILIANILMTLINIGFYIILYKFLSLRFGNKDILNSESKRLAFIFAIGIILAYIISFFLPFGPFEISSSVDSIGTL